MTLALDTPKTDLDQHDGSARAGEVAPPNASEADAAPAGIGHELRRHFLDPGVAPHAIVLVLLIAGVLTGALVWWSALVFYAVFAPLYMAHRRAVVSDELEHLASPDTDTAGAEADVSLETADLVPEPSTHELPWRSLLDALPDPALVLDAESYIVHYNPAVADLYPRVRIGLPLTRLTRNAALLSALDRAAPSDGPRIVQLEDRVPVRRSLSAIITDVVSEGGEMVPSRLIVLRDLTDQQRHAQLRSDFIAHASHELRTPLASLKSMVETLQGPARNDPSAHDRFLAMMQTQATRMARLIDDLLSLSRAEMRVHVTPTGRVELNDLMGWIAEAMEPMAQSLETTVELRQLPGPAWVRGDRDDLVQVFQNLIHNALKYGREGGKVTLEVQRLEATLGRPERIAVSVIDDGPGIAPEHIPRLTERFYRVSKKESREKGGTGLGLAIVKYIVTRHRGELNITSTLGQGSRFTIVLDAIAAT